MAADQEGKRGEKRGGKRGEYFPVYSKQLVIHCNSSVQYLSPVNWFKKRNNLFITLFKNNSINIYVKITKQSEIRLTFKTRYSNKANLYDFYPPKK